MAPAQGPSGLCVYGLLFVVSVLLSFVCGQPAGYQPVDGFGNNPNAPENVVVNAPYLRLVEETGYVDGISVPGSTASSARLVSNMIFKETDNERLSLKGLNTIHMSYGQFIAHDLMLAGEPGDPAEAEGETGGEDFPIAVPQGDPEFDPFGTGTQELPFHRSSAAVGTGTTSPRSPPNRVTSVVDGSTIYGSSLAVTETLRNETHRHLLKVRSPLSWQWVFALHVVQGSVAGLPSPTVLVLFVHSAAAFAAQYL